jgi:hypothetical protein
MNSILMNQQSNQISGSPDGRRMSRPATISGPPPMISKKHFPRGHKYDEDSTDDEMEDENNLLGSSQINLPMASQSSLFDEESYRGRSKIIGRNLLPIFNAHYHWKEQCSKKIGQRMMRINPEEENSSPEVTNKYVSPMKSMSIGTKLFQSLDEEMSHF